MNEVTADASKGSVFEDVLEVMWAPAKVFDRSRAKGVGMYILVLTAVTLVVVLATKGLIQPYVDANFDLQMQQMAAKGKPMPAEAMAAAQKFAGYGFLATGVLMIPIGAVLTGLLVWIGGKVASARFTFGQAMLIATLPDSLVLGCAFAVGGGAQHVLTFLIRRLSGLGIDFKDLKTHQSSLEEIFVSLVHSEGRHNERTGQ